MRKTNSNSTKPTPLTKEELERRSNLLCRNMTNYGNCSFGDRCHYSHEMTRPVYDRRSHKREPSPPKEAAQTEEELIDKLIEDFSGFGKSSKKYLKATNKLEFLKALVVFNKSLTSLAPTEDNSAINYQSLINSMTAFLGSSDNEAFRKFIEKNIKACEKGEEALSVFNGIREAFVVPDEAMRLFCVPETEAGQSSYAGALKVDQLELAKRTPEAIPSKEFLDYLAITRGLDANTGFMTMRGDHERLEAYSAYRVKDFLAILTLFEASKETKRRLEELERQELAVQQEANVKVALMRECLTTGNPHLKTAFSLLTSLSELTAFAKALSEEEQKVLISVFGSFVAYVSHQVQMNLSFKITCDSLKSLFETFTKSRCVDHESHKLKSGFCDFVKTPEFNELRKLLGTKTSSVQRKTGATLDVGEIFKRMLKELLSIYLDKVKPENRDRFCIDLVKHLLPFAYLVFLATSNSYMLSGQWKKGYMREENLVEVYDYTEMSNGREKSILYWLLQGLRSKAISSKKKYSSIDSFAKLSSLFTSLETSSDGESKQVFNPDLLFDALNEVLKTNFLNAGNFPVTMQSLENQKSSLFKIDESKVLSVSVSDSVAYCLYLGYGSSQDDLKTRQFSDMTALFKCDRTFLVEIVSSWNSSSYGSSSEKSIAILRTMKFENQSKKIVNAMEAFMKLLEESKKDDLLRRAYDIMSLANKVVEIQGSIFFMSLVDALLVVLLQDKLKKVKFLDIMNMVYVGKNNMNEMKISFPKVKTYCEKLDARDTMKQRLTDLLCEGYPRSDDKELEELGKVVQVLEPLLCKKDLPDESIHGCLKRGMPFILDSFSLTLLLGTVSGFERVEADDASPDITKWLAENAKSFFERELDRFITGQVNQISCDLSKRMKEVELPADRLKAVGFVKFQSSIVNLINRVFSSIGLPYKLIHETFCVDFPKTSRCVNPEERIVNHAMKVLSTSNGDFGFPITKQTHDLLQPLILKAVHAVCRTEVSKSKEETVLKVDTVQISFVKAEIGSSNTINLLFNNCLSYWKLNFVRELIVGILQHVFSTANVQLVRELHTLVLKYDIQFSVEELKPYNELFTFLRSTDESIPTDDSKLPYETSDEVFLQMVRDSIQSDHWIDTKQVEVSKPILRKALKGIRIRKVRQPDSGMAIGGGPAPEPDLEEESESDPEPVEQSKCQCDIDNLRSILTSGNKTYAIEYLNSVNLDEDEDEVLIEVLQYLQTPESNCAGALEAVNQSYD